jgi:hypothetical protein
MSIEDKAFLSIMDKEMCKDIDGRWMAPLPFKQDRERLPNNRKLTQHIMSRKHISANQQQDRRIWI